MTVTNDDHSVVRLGWRFDWRHRRVQSAEQRRLCARRRVRICPGWIRPGRGHDIAANGFNPLFTSRTREDWLETTRLRLGWAFGHVLVYGTGGAAFVNAEASAAGPGFPSISQEKWRIGLVYGGGVEWAVAPNWTTKLEYLHIDFENQQYFTPPPAGFVNRSGGVTLTDDIVRIGLNYKLAREAAAPLK